MKFFKNNRYTILKNVSRFIFVIVLFFCFLFSSIIVNANNPAGGTGSLTIQTGIENPLGDDLKDIPSFIVAIINIVLLIGVPIVTLAIIYSGFLFLQAQGNSEKLGTAKKALLYSVIGAVLLLGAFVLAEAIKGTVDQIK